MAIYIGAILGLGSLAIFGLIIICKTDCILL